jgi:alkanesulfonate monooxygenase SsuD/methylene tetrahydromethanopterin reductase-like flavin-dependent oxidoreductase (luciferase family)
MRFGALLLPDVPWPQLVARARAAERLGFDWVWLDDHAFHPARPDGPWLETWTALAGLAAATERVRVGPLVANVVLRPPVVLARQARTVEQIAGGRLEVGLGAGYAATDHAAVGETPWAPPERAERFAEAVALVDALLRGGPVTFSGRHYAAREMVLAPPPWHAPRPPLAIAAHGPRALAVAARHADTWVSYGGFGCAPDEVVALTRRRGAALDAACRDAGRDPRTIRRRLLTGSAALTQAPLWRAPEDFLAFAAPLADAGIDELALHFPPEPVNPPGSIPAGAVERIAAEAFPLLRGQCAAPPSSATSSRS